MKIGIEGLSLQKHPGGIGKYFLSLVEVLVENYPDVTFFCYSNKKIHLPDHLSDRIILRIDTGIASKLKSNVWLKLIARRIINYDQLDFYFSSAGFFPVLNKGVKKIALVHDLNYRIVPKTMGWFHWISHFLFFKKDIKSADFILTNSKGTSDKILQYVGVQSNAIINPACSSIYKPLTSDEIASTLERYQITTPYLLTVGTLEPRKNLSLTINIFLHLLHDNELHNHKLVIVGDGGWKNAEIIALCDSRKFEILRLGYVPEEDLPKLYNGATAFLFPSIYEGFGMPVREAIRCACPVITTDSAELREASYGKASYIDPTNEHEYINAITSILKTKIKIGGLKTLKNTSEMSTFLDFFKTE